jgi:hypothetical protein
MQLGYNLVPFGTHDVNACSNTLTVGPLCILLHLMMTTIYVYHWFTVVVQTYIITLNTTLEIFNVP